MILEAAALLAAAGAVYRAAKGTNVQERALAEILNTSLGAFVEDLDVDDLSANLLDGEVDLGPVRLNPRAFDDLGVPVALVAGAVGHVRVELDWKNLGSVPVKISIDSVCAVVRLSPRGSDDEPEPEPEPEPEMEHESDLPSFILKWKADIESNIRKIVENIQFTLTNVHVRLEDHVTAQVGGQHDKSRCFAMGVTVERLAITNAVERKRGVWVDGFVDDPMQITTKRIRLGDEASDARDRSCGLALYCNSGARRWDEGGGQPVPRSITKSTNNFMKKMRQMIGDDSLSYVVKPIQAEVLYHHDNSEGEGYSKGKTRVKKYLRVVDAEQTDHDFRIEVRKQKFDDGKYRYEPLDDVSVMAGDISVVLDSQTLRYILSLGSWVAGQAGQSGSESNAERYSSSSDEDSSNDDETDSGNDETSSSDDGTSSDDETSSDEDELPSDWTKLRLSFNLHQASLVLTRDAGRVPIRQCKVCEIECNVGVREGGGISAQVGLGDLTIYDMRTAASSEHGKDAILQKMNESTGNLFDLRVESSYLAGQRCDLTGMTKLSSNFDLRLKLVVEPVQCVFDLYSTKDLVTWKSDIVDDIDEVLDKDLRTRLSATATQWYSERKAKLKEQAMREAVRQAQREKQQLNLDISLSAPTILIPANGSTSDPGCIEVTLGEVRVQTQSKTRDADDDHDVLEVALHGLGVQLGPAYILEPVNLECDILLPMLLHAGKLEILWSNIDEDVSGDIDRDELSQLMFALGEVTDRAELDSVMHEIDQDDSGKIDKNEFMKWWEQNHTHQTHSNTTSADGIDVLVSDTTVNISNDFVDAVRRAQHMWKPTDPHLSLRSSDCANGIGTDTGVITCHSRSAGWRRKLYDMGITELEVRKNRTWKRSPTKLLFAWEICFKVHKADLYAFTDKTGDVYEKDCATTTERYKIAFNSDDPTLILIESGGRENAASWALSRAAEFVGEAGVSAAIKAVSLAGISISEIHERKMRHTDFLLTLVNSVSLAKVVLPFVKAKDAVLGGDTLSTLKDIDVDAVLRFHLSQSKLRGRARPSVSQRQLSG